MEFSMTNDRIVTVPMKTDRTPTRSVSEGEVRRALNGSSRPQSVRPRVRFGLVICHHPLCAFVVALAVLWNAAAATAQADDKVSVWNGYEKRDFQVDGRNCFIVVPKKAAEGQPWIWRTEFFGHEPQADLALAAKGFHLAYVDVQNMYGAPKALDHMDKFYEHLTTVRGLSKKVVLEGFSRGGLFSLNWAARNPNKVACIYNDAPVCDFKSWPGGKGKGNGLTEQQALEYKLNPIDNLEPLAKAKIPLLHICGDADDVVPIDENTRIVEERYKKLGGPITVIVKPGVGHHPHSLVNPEPIVSCVF
jgi:predicted esterase